MVGYCPFGEAQSFGDAVPQLKFVCPAETAHDVGKVDGGEESEQVKDDNFAAGSSAVATACGVLLYIGLSPF